MSLIRRKDLAEKIGMAESTLAVHLCSLDSYRFKSGKKRKIIQYRYSLEFLEILKAKFEIRTTFGRQKEYFIKIVKNIEKLIDEENKQNRMVY